MYCGIKNICFDIYGLLIKGELIFIKSDIRFFVFKEKTISE
jgi:hypothetical protein